MTELDEMENRHLVEWNEYAMRLKSNPGPFSEVRLESVQNCINLLEAKRNA